MPPSLASPTTLVIRALFPCRRFSFTPQSLPRSPIKGVGFFVSGNVGLTSNRDEDLKAEKPYAVAKTFWEDSQKYLYLPRLRNIDVLENAIRTGAATREFFGTALAIDDEKYVGFQLGNASIQLDDTLLLIDPIVAGAYDLRVKEDTAAAKGYQPQIHLQSPLEVVEPQQPLKLLLRPR